MAKAKQLPSGNWRVQAKLTIDGKTIVRSFTAETARKAEALALQWQELTKEENKIDNITLRQAYERYIAAKEKVLSPGTVREYKRSAERDLQSIMDLKLTALTQEKIQSAINIEAATHSPKTIRNMHGLLSSVLAMFMPDITLHTTLPQKKPTEMYIPDDEDIKKLIAAVKDTRLEIPVLLAAFGPMRRGEICALTSDDIKGNTVTINKSLVQNERGEWEIKAPKTVSSYRSIDFPDFVIDRIKGISGKITDMTPTAITSALAKCLKNNNIPHFRFHDLRHYNVSILHAMNVPDKYIMARGGWRTNYTMNNVYKHALKTKQNEFDTKITDHFSELCTDIKSHEMSHENCKY